ncbi:hypothetical protein TRFO_18252 [Tritrichomonas foetus]|uniref:Uncharacterized protein n=1 Tax=Tritrichomonas foetus TaxID=1144522 RepID=A0A1J4KL82_9EUKA|nr:hypothetical protein TRFO_18252 [Tritrichomonas foetus]|eukprot:OHT12057.1 hypothetical protein TRFO_18252 [Tritrichomonas foetus]
MSRRDYERRPDDRIDDRRFEDRRPTGPRYDDVHREYSDDRRNPNYYSRSDARDYELVRSKPYDRDRDWDRDRDRDRDWDRDRDRERDWDRGRSREPSNPPGERHFNASSWQKVAGSRSMSSSITNERGYNSSDRSSQGYHERSGFLERSNSDQIRRDENPKPNFTDGWGRSPSNPRPSFSSSSSSSSSSNSSRPERSNSQSSQYIPPRNHSPQNPPSLPDVNDFEPHSTSGTKSNVTIPLPPPSPRSHQPYDELSIPQNMNVSKSPVRNVPKQITPMNILPAQVIEMNDIPHPKKTEERKHEAKTDPGPLFKPINKKKHKGLFLDVNSIQQSKETSIKKSSDSPKNDNKTFQKQNSAPAQKVDLPSHKTTSKPVQRDTPKVVPKPNNKPKSEIDRWIEQKFTPDEQNIILNSRKAELPTDLPQNFVNFIQEFGFDVVLERKGWQDHPEPLIDEIGQFENTLFGNIEYFADYLIKEKDDPWYYDKNPITRELVMTEDEKYNQLRNEFELDNIEDVIKEQQQKVEEMKKEVRYNLDKYINEIYENC